MTRTLAIVFVVLSLAYTALACVVPYADDELYYWCWQEHLQLSYYDHPAMTALFIRASVSLFGDSLVAIRLPACLATAFVFAVMLHLTRPARVAWWVLLSPLFTVGAVLITPDTPLLAFWAAYVVWLVDVHKRLDSGRALPAWVWPLGGVLLGCGVLGKYTTALAGVAGFASFLAAGKWRRGLCGYALHGLIAVAVASPILIYNIQEDFAPLKYQWGHSMESHAPGLKPFGDFLGMQILLFGTLPLVLFPWVVANFRRLIVDPRLRVCACLYGLPYAFFLYKATRGPLEGNWALACYIAFWPLAGVWYDGVRASRWWRILAPASFAVPALVAVGALVHLATPNAFLPPRIDRITRQAVKYEVAGKLRDTIRERGESLPVYCASYQMTALLRFHGLDARQMDGVTRPSHFTRPAQHLSDVSRAYVVWEGVPPDDTTPGCELIEIVAAFPIDVRGTTLAYYTILLYRKPGA